MLSFVLRRLLILVPMLVAISLAAFALAELSPSDPAEIAIRVNAMVPTPELVAETRRALGLDQPFFVRYGDWLSRAVTGDFGSSWVTGLPVAQSLAEALPATLALAATALVIILVVSLAAGVASARAENSPLDLALRGFMFLASSMPGFWAALLLIWLFSVTLDWLPTSGMRSPESVILPAVTLALSYIGTYMRLIRSEMLRTAHEDWVLFARGRGLGEARIMRRMIRNSLRGSAAALGMSIPKLIAGAFVVETIFAWPGVGRLCVEAVFNRDLPVIVAYVLMMAVLFGVFNLAADIALQLLDPAERRRGEAS